MGRARHQQVAADFLAAFAIALPDAIDREVLLDIAKRRVDRLTMGVLQAPISVAIKCYDGDGFWCTEGQVPAGDVLFLMRLGGFDPVLRRHRRPRAL